MLLQHVEQRRRRDGRLHRGAARWRRTGFGVMQVDATDRIVDFVEKPADPPGMPGQARPGAGQHGHLRVRDPLPVRPAAPRRGRCRLQPRFRQGHHPLHLVQQRQGGGASLRALLRALAAPRRRPTGATSARSMPIGGQYRPDRYRAGARPLRPRLADLDLCRDHARRPSSSTTRTAGAARPISSLVSGGCIVSGARLRRSLLFTGVRVHSYARCRERGDAALCRDRPAARG